MRWVILFLLLLGFAFLWWTHRLPPSVTAYLPEPPASTNLSSYFPTGGASTSAWPSSSSSAPTANPSAPPPPFTTCTVLDCSFQIPSGWEIYSSGNPFGARNGGKSFEVKTQDRKINWDFNSAAFSNLMMLSSPYFQGHVIADTRDPFQGHPAYNALVRTADQTYRGVRVFALGKTYYILAGMEKTNNPFNDSQLNAIFDSVTLNESPAH